MIQSALRAARRAFLPLLLSCAAPVALAGNVTIYESQLDGIFAQAGIDIRIDAARTVVNSAWTLMSDADFRAASTWAKAPAQGLAAKTVPVFFIDDFDADIGNSVIGLGWVGAPFFAVESRYAASAVYGSSLVAHELGHNLGLTHVATEGDLMFSFIDFHGKNVALTTDQIDTILASNLVQTDAAGHRYVELAPFAVVAVPEPATWAMLLGGMAALTAFRRRKA